MFATESIAAHGQTILLLIRNSPTGTVIAPGFVARQHPI